MKITFEQTSGEPEVIIRGAADDPLVQVLLSACRNTAGGTARLLLYRDGRTFVQEIRGIDWMEAAEGGVAAHIGAQTLEAKQRLYELAEMTRPYGFVQISKSVLVNVACIRSVTAEFSGNYLAELKDGRTRLVISRRYLHGFWDYVKGGAAK